MNKKIHKCKNNLRFGVISFITPKGIIGDIVGQCSKCKGYFIVPEHREVYPTNIDLSTHNIQWFEE